MCGFSVDIGHALKVICCCREMQKLHHCSDKVLALRSSKRLQAASIVTIIIRQLSSPPTPTIQRRRPTVTRGGMSVMVMFNENDEVFA